MNKQYDCNIIQDLLEKSDRNEAVDDSIENLLRKIPAEEDLEAKILGESETEDISEDKKELLQAKRKQIKKNRAKRKD